MAESNRLLAVERLRFLAAIAIAAIHFQEFCFPDGPLRLSNLPLADAFFIISGFFLMRSATKADGDYHPLDSIRYTLHRVRKVYLPYLIALVFTFACTCIIDRTGDIAALATQLFHFKWEFLLLQMAGFNPNPTFNVDYLMGAGWFLSALFIMMVPVHYLAARHRKALAGLIAPLSIVCIYAYMMQTAGTINMGNELIGGFLLAGLPRAFAGLCAGTLSYEAFLWLQQKKPAAGKGAAIFGEVVLFGSFLIPLFWGSWATPADGLFYVPIVCIFLVVTMLDRTPISHWFNTFNAKAGAYLGQLSMYIYLFQWGIVLLWASFVHGLGYWPSLGLFLLVVVALSCGIKLLVERVQRAWRGQKQG